MGSVIAKMVFKNGKEPVATDAKSLWELSAIDIDGKKISNLGSVAGAKCTLVVNVAT